jgi:hypothetical protein
MARGQDTSRDLTRQVKQQHDKSLHMFGIKTFGGADNGERGMDNTPLAAPVGGHLPRPTGGAAGPGFSNPVYHSAEPLRIHLDTERVHYQDAMAGLMIPPADNESHIKMVDRGMRESEGEHVKHPVQSWVDETIKLPKKG